MTKKRRLCAENLTPGSGQKDEEGRKHECATVQKLGGKSSPGDDDIQSCKKGSSAVEELWLVTGSQSLLVE